jgi:hypothetical protein
MPPRALFSGLIVDETDRPVETRYIGDEPCYVVDDDGFMRHIPAKQVDEQILTSMREMIEGHEDAISNQAAKMLGQDDIFSIAMIANQLKNIDQQFENLYQIGIPDEARAYMGMMGFKIRINIHGDVLEINQPGIASDDEG